MNPINTLSNRNNDNDSEPARNALADYTEKAKQAIAEMPLFVKIVPIVMISVYILAVFFWQISFYLSNMLQYTLFKFQLWRIISANIVMTSFFNILFAFLFWIPEAMKLERAHGSVRFIMLFAANGVIIQFLYALLLIPLMLLFGERLLMVGYNKNSHFVECNGIWPIIMMDITVLCLAQPDNLISFFCLPFSLKAKYYPFILLAFFTLLNGIQFDSVVGVIYGIAYVYLLQSKLNFSEAFIAKCEESFAFKWMKSFKGFISSEASTGLSSNNLGLSYQNQTNSNAQSSQPQAGFNQENQAFSAFKGKGVIVGGGNV